MRHHIFIIAACISLLAGCASGTGGKTKLAKSARYGYIDNACPTFLSRSYRLHLRLCSLSRNFWESQNDISPYGSREMGISDQDSVDDRPVS